MTAKMLNFYIKLTESDLESCISFLVEYLHENRDLQYLNAETASALNRLRAQLEK